MPFLYLINWVMLCVPCSSALTSPCDLTRLDLQAPGAAERFSKHFRGKHAVLLDGLVDNAWPGRNWSIEVWRDILGDTPLPWRRQSTIASSGGAHSAQEFSGEAFFNASSVSQAVGVSDTSVVFSTSSKDIAVRKLMSLGVIRAPGFLEQMQLHPVLSIGGVDEGLPYHQHDEAWLALLHGAKQWFLRRPEAQPRTGKHRVSAEDLQAEPQTFVCQQKAGEVLYFPDFWWHSTYNLNHHSSNMTIGVGGVGKSLGMNKMFVDGDVTSLQSIVKTNKDILQQAKEKGSFSAAKWGHTSILDWLRSLGVKLNEQVDESGEALVHTSAGSGHIEVMSWLLSNRADVHARESPMNGAERGLQKQPMHIAAENGHIPLMAWLASHGVALNSKHAHDLKPFDQACRAGHMDVAKWLLNHHHSNVKLKGKSGGGSMVAAAAAGHVDVLELLVERRAVLGLKNDKKLWHAVTARGHGNVIAWLFRRRASMLGKDSEGVPWP